MRGRRPVKVCPFLVFFFFSVAYTTRECSAGLEHARLFLEPIKEKHPWISYADLWTLAGVTAVSVRSISRPSSLLAPPASPRPLPLGTNRPLLRLSQAMGGPTTPWKPGRTDFVDESKCPPRGRLPDGAQAADHIREVFQKRMGFNDQEIVALMGAHSLGVRLLSFPSRFFFNNRLTHAFAGDNAALSL